MTSEGKRLRERLEAIKAYADSGCKLLPEEFAPTVTDERYMGLMIAWSANERAGRYTPEIAAELWHRYGTMYFNEKRAEERLLASYAEDLERRKRGHDVHLRMMKTEYRSASEMLADAVAYIGVLSGDAVTERKLREKAEGLAAAPSTTPSARSPFPASGDGLGAATGTTPHGTGAATGTTPSTTPSARSPFPIACDNGDGLGAAPAKRAAKREFVKPKLDDVRAYWTMTGLKGDPAAFFDHYEGNGWIQNKGKPIVDWKAAARNWARREDDFKPRGKKTESVFSSDASYDLEAYRKAAIGLN